MSSRCAVLSGWTILLLFPLLSTAAILTSATGRFRVSGADAADAIRYAYWAEEDTLRLERVLGMPVPVIHGAPVEIILGTSSDFGAMPVAQCVWQGRSFRRVLKVRTGMAPATPILREGLISLLLDGMVELRRNDSHLPSLIPNIPDWLSAGLVRNLDKGESSFDREVLAETGEEEDGTPVADILKWVELPPEWHSRRAVCGLMTDWLLSFQDGANTLIARLASGKTLSPEWIAITAVGAGSTEGMESRWRAWRRRGEGFVRDFGGLTPGLVSRLRRELPLEVSVAGTGKAAATVVRLRPPDVIGARKKYPAVSAAAFGKIGQIRILTIGKAPELRDAGELYCRFYESVARGAWPRTLVSQLKEAESALDQLETLTRERERYLDAFEKGEAAGGGGADETPLPEIEKSRIESYLDEADKRLHKP